MGGPGAAILFEHPLTDEKKDMAYAEIKFLADAFFHERGVNEWEDNFWIAGEPFCYDIGEEYEGELLDYQEELEGSFEWVPQDIISLGANCNNKVSHRLLGYLCMRFARKLDGIIDFGGTLLPNSRDKVFLRLWSEHFSGKRVAWKLVERYHTQMVKGMRGRLWSIHDEGWPCHMCDHEFMEAWLNHKDFHMIK